MSEMQPRATAIIYTVLVITWATVTNHPEGNFAGPVLGFLLVYVSRREALLVLVSYLS